MTIDLEPLAGGGLIKDKIDPARALLICSREVQFQPVQPFAFIKGRAYRCLGKIDAFRGAEFGGGEQPLVAEPPSQSPVQGQRPRGIAGQQYPRPPFIFKNGDSQGIAAIDSKVSAPPIALRGLCLQCLLRGQTLAQARELESEIPPSALNPLLFPGKVEHKKQVVPGTG